MSYKKFCPKCGKETELLLKGKCKNCFLKGSDLFSIKDIKIKLCGKCNKLLIQGNWVECNAEAIIEEISSKVKPINELEKAKIIVELEKIDEKKFNVKLKVIGFIDSMLIEQEKNFVLGIEKGLCDPCMRLGSDYREAIIQLRSDSKETAEQMLMEAKQFIDDEKRFDPLSGVVKTIKTKNGFDLWVGSKKASLKVANKLAKIYSTKPTVSSKLIGSEKTGKRKYRFTFCIRG